MPSGRLPGSEGYCPPCIKCIRRQTRWSSGPRNATLSGVEVAGVAGDCTTDNRALMGVVETSAGRRWSSLVLIDRCDVHAHRQKSRFVPGMCRESSRHIPGGLTPFRRSGGSESRPVARGRGQGDWSDHVKQQEASHPGAGRPQARSGRPHARRRARCRGGVSGARGVRADVLTGGGTSTAASRPTTRSD